MPTHEPPSPLHPVPLLELASRCAESLVAHAMRRLVDQTARGELVVTVTAEATPAPRQLTGRVQKKRGRKLGPKPGKRKYTRRAARGEAATPAPPPASPSSDPLASRTCRHCHARGTAVRVTGTEREVRCRSCGGVWQIRLKATEKAAPRPRGVKAASAPGACRRCDHAKAVHDEGGRCLAAKCVCTEFYD